MLAVVFERAHEFQDNGSPKWEQKDEPHGKHATSISLRGMPSNHQRTSEQWDEESYSLSGL
jgi:hypothetical protein